MLKVINNKPQYKEGTCYFISMTEVSGKAELTDSKKINEKICQLKGE